MVVTGASWQSITLGKLIPALDPNQPGSAASRLNCEIDKISSSIGDNLKKVTNLTDAVANTLDTVGQLGDQIGELQKQIEDLIGNAVNTGVFMHTLGLNPIFSATSPSAIAGEIARTFSDTKDPNRPVFKGEGLAIVGGVMILISAPNIKEMQAAIQRLATVFPVFKGAVESIVKAGEKTADVFNKNFMIPIDNSLSELDTTFSNLQNVDLVSAKPFSSLVDQFVSNANDVKFDGFETRLFNKWFALRLCDLIPALDPTKEGPAKAILDAERALVGGGASLLQQAHGLASGVRQLTQAVNYLNQRLQQLATDVQDLVTAISQTGMFVHTIGLDGTVTNNIQFVTACSRALTDATDPNRPRAAGQMEAFAGMELVFGAANPLGLQGQFKVIGSVFGGLETNVKQIGGAGKAFGTL
jgi:methyl-accepting chemotaxis protein